MICHAHRNQQAIGICKLCWRGLCADCAHDNGGGIVCFGPCPSQTIAAPEPAKPFLKAAPARPASRVVHPRAPMFSPRIRARLVRSAKPILYLAGAVGLGMASAIAFNWG